MFGNSFAAEFTLFTFFLRLLFMRQTYRLLLVLVVAATSLSSCSRSSYSFNTNAPAYLGSEQVHVATSAAPQAAEKEIAAVSTEAQPSATVATPVVHVARAHRAATAPLAHAAAAASTVASQPAAAVKFDRKAFKHELKRQLAAAPKNISAEGKSQLVAVLLCFFLGGLGIHDFYMGYVGKGILQIILSILIVGFILVIIDFIRLLTGSLKPKDGDWGTKL
jgi:hypothetical protein